MRLFIAFFSFCCLLTACGNNASAPAASELSTTIAEAEKQLGYTSTSISCLAKEGKSLCEFLDQTLIAKYLPEGAEISGYKAEERGMLSSCGASVQHPSKKLKIGGEKFSMEVPAEYTISLSSVRSHDDAGQAQNRFAQEYKVITPEEAERLREQLAASLQQKVAAGEMTQEQADLSKGFGGAIGKSVWMPVEGIGDLAVWGNALPDKESPTSGTLAVLIGDTQFSLEVDLLESKEASKAAALELARSVLAVCE